MRSKKNSPRKMTQTSPWIMKGLATLLVLFSYGSFFHCAVAATNKKENASKPACSVLTWPYGDKLADSELSKIFHKTKRTKLIAYWFGELSTAKHPELVHHLGDFLETTEPDELMQGYFQVIMHGADPEDGSNQVKPLDPKELCENYLKTKKAIQ